MTSAVTGRTSRGRPASLLRFGFLGVLLCLALPLLGATTGYAQKMMPITPSPDKCASGELRPKTGLNLSLTGAGPGESQPDLLISGRCIVKLTGDYYYAKVNITNGGVLIFQEGPSSDLDKVTNFWARSIIVESGGTMKAGVDDKPYGSNLHTLNIILYGKDQSAGHPETNKAGGDTCVQDNCGVPKPIWDSNGKGINDKDDPPTLDNGVKDYFYQYGPMYGTATGYYGYKVLAVGYAGTLQLRGWKGTAQGERADNNTTLTDAQRKTMTGSSWKRLAGGNNPGEDLKAPGGKTLILDGDGVNGDWQAGDKIVVTTTDYLPGHSEELTIDTVDKTKITLKDAVKWDHVGKAFQLKALLAGAGDRLTKAGMDTALQQSAETRAAVALLTRSIRIVSGGDVAGEYFDCVSNDNGKTWYAPKELSHDNKDILIEANKNSCATQRASTYLFGAHTVFRQGFKTLQLQGVEFHQMGQGGRMAHYPVHFHMARQVPAETYIKDSSVSESMTRWYVLHSTLGVTLQRNVGWKSIGHGYFLEDGTETDNKLYANIGIYARGGVVGPENPRNIPGILAENTDKLAIQYRSDVVYPTVFWITNGWNEFVGNMAAGAGTCGSCFWFLPAINTDMIEVQKMTPGNMKHMNWSGYAGRQTAGHAADTPVKLFYKNYCSTAMHSLNTSDGVSTCDGVRFLTEHYDKDIRLVPVQSVAPAPKPEMEMYYPNFSGNRYPTVCDPSLKNDQPNACTGPYDTNTGVNNNDANNVVKRCNNSDPKDCGITVIDHYTSSFNWAEKNFSAIWLRTPGWFLLDNSFISDVQNGGVTFVTGGDYSRSSTALGYWGLLGHSVLVGATNPDNNYASAAGPPGAMPPLAAGIVCDRSRGNACISLKDSVAYPLSDWSTGQRLFNIYDGPAHQDGNAYVNIKVSGCNNNTDGKCMYFGTPGVRRYVPKQGEGYLPNAAIGWKQPNGFYYPPAFHSKNLYFNNVDIRHYVIQPLFEIGSYRTKDKQVEDDFIGGVEGAKNKFSGFTDVDRQTELNDDDGTLTGFINTISVNEDGFFGAPIQAPQCKSNVGVNPDAACAGKTITPSKTQQPQTARTSPYDYVTTVIYPGCAMNGKGGDSPLEGKDPKVFGACGTMPPDPDPLPPSPYQPLPRRYDDKPGDRFKEVLGRGGSWSKECGGPYCYGVPIYRQYLTGKSGHNDKGEVIGTPTREWSTWYDNKCGTQAATNDKCNFPFARMNGASEWQRDVMTVNNGKFYIDTTRSKDGQLYSEALGKPGEPTEAYVECSKQTSGNCQPRSVNVFEATKTYMVFFLFAKNDTQTKNYTKQTYQIYVGEGFKPDTGFKGVKITGTENRFKYDEWTTPWKAEMIGSDGKPNPTGDILQVTVDFSQVTGVQFDPKKAISETCKPASFCQWGMASIGGAGSCDTSLKDNDPRVVMNPNLKNIAKKICSEWAVKDLDCPAGGCLGFAFTLPDKFEAKNQYKRPTPEDIKDTDSVWSKFSFKQAGQSASDCTYDDGKNTPGKGSCGVPDCANGMVNPPFCDKPTP